MPDRLVLRIVSLILAAVGLACDDPSGGPRGDCAGHRVRMGVASSLREVARPLSGELEAHEPRVAIDLILGASSVLARQIELGAPMDVFVSADGEIVDDLVRRGLLDPDSPVEFARGRLAVVARPDWPGLASESGGLDWNAVERIAIPGAAVPLGRYARAWLAGREPLGDGSERIVTTEHARATLSTVDSGLVDLAIVYESDARLARNAVVIARIDPVEHPPIRYVAARVAAAPPCESIDAALLAWSGARMRERIAEFGFLPGEPTEAEGSAKAPAPTEAEGSAKTPAPTEAEGSAKAPAPTESRRPPTPVDPMELAP